MRNSDEIEPDEEADEDQECFFIGDLDEDLDEQECFFIGDLEDTNLDDLERGVASRSDEYALSSFYNRYAVLIAVSTICAASNYSYDIPSALQSQFKDYLNDGAAQFEFRFNLLYSVYSLPNLVLPFFGGLLLDRMGTSVGVILFSSLCALGQMIFSLGLQYRIWTLMWLGRFGHGLGGQNLEVAASVVLAHWFGDQLAFAFGIGISIARLGTVANTWASPVLAAYRSSSASTSSLPLALWTGTILNIISLIPAIYVSTLEMKREKFQRRIIDDTRMLQRNDSAATPNDAAHDNSLEEPLLTDAAENTDDIQEDMILSMLDACAKLGSTFWFLCASCIFIYGTLGPWNNVASGILQERTYFRPVAPIDCSLPFPDQCTFGALQPNHTNMAVDSHGNKCLSANSGFAPLLPISLNITDEEGNVIYENPMVTAVDVDCESEFWSVDCTQDYCKAKAEATAQADHVIAIPFAICAFLAPVLGWVIDGVGQRARIIVVASLTLVLVHFVLAFTEITPVLPMIGQGLAYTAYASAFWPCAPLVVSPEAHGIAFGALLTAQQVGMLLVPLIVALVYDLAGSHFLPQVELVFIACTVLGLVAGIVVNVLDGRCGGSLNSKVQSPSSDNSLSEEPTMEGE